MDAEHPSRTATTHGQEDRELRELQALLARAERGNTSDDRCAALIFRDLIRRRIQH